MSRTKSSGLGILVEEQEEKPTRILTPVSESEVLLPPLPEGELSGNLQESKTASKGDVERKDSKDTINSTIITPSTAGSVHDDYFSFPMDAKDLDFESFKKNPKYELDSPNLKIDPIFVDMGLVEQSRLTLPSPTNTSPLKKLKSLRNGIRKLSLSRTNSISNGSASAATPSTGGLHSIPTVATTLSNDTPSTNEPSVSRKSHSPKRESIEQDLLSCLSTVDSLTLSERPFRASITSTNLASPTTPPVNASPVITISENLTSSKKNVSNIEQNFFDNLSNGLCKISSVSELNGVQELVEYLSFLNELRSLVNEAYKATKDRLIKCGWCSKDDLNNLQFQLDASLLQIDSKILKVEQILNELYNMSIISDSQSK